MKNFIEKLMNQLPFVIIQSIHWYGVLDKSDESIFLFLQSFFLEKTTFDHLFFHITESFISDTSGETNKFRLQDCLLRPLGLVMV